MQWFRLYSEARNDAKLRYLSDAEHRVWFNLLCLANEQEERGAIPAMPENILAVEVAGADEDLLAATLAKLAAVAIIEEREDGALVFINFAKRNYDKPSDKPERVKERVTRHRQRKRNAPVTLCNAKATPGNDPYYRVQSTETEREVPPPDPPPVPDASPAELATLHELQGVERYPFIYAKDLAFVRTLAVEFPSIDLLDQAKRWRVYKLDKPLKPTSNPRSQFRTWCAKAAEWAQEGRSRDAPRPDPVPPYVDPYVPLAEVELTDEQRRAADEERQKIRQSLRPRGVDTS